MRRETRRGVYRTKAARPAAAARPAYAVWRAPPAEEVEVPEPVALLKALEAALERLLRAAEAELEACMMLDLF